MKLHVQTLGTMLIASLGLCVTSAHAQDDFECIQGLTDCFKFEEQARAGCFQRSAGTISCLDSEQGRLALKRGGLYGATGEANSDLSPTPEPNIVDPDCVDNFDSFWLGNLVNGPMSSETLANLNEMLDGCRRTATHDLLRP
jgi:hypothetical protein